MSPYAVPPTPDAAPPGPDAGTPSQLVVAGVLLDDPLTPTRFLVARRSAPPALAGLWEFPGGKVEPGETPTAALARELAEELGVGVRVLSALPGPQPHPDAVAGAWPLGPSGVVMAVFFAHADGPPAPLQDHDALAWLTPAEVDGVRWVPPDRPIADAVASRLAGGVRQADVADQ